MTHDKPVMTFGTSGGLDYMVLAHSGTFGLSAKFYGITPGQAFHQNGTLIVFRLRSSDVAEQLNAIEHDFDPDAVDDPAKAWPTVQFEKGDITYQSTSLALRLDIELNPSNLGPVVRALDKLDVAECLLKKIEATVQHPSQIIASKAAIMDYLEQAYRPLVEKMRVKAMEQAQAIEDNPAVAPGAFHTSGEMLSKLVEKTQKGKGGLGLH